MTHPEAEQPSRVTARRDLESNHIAAFHSQNESGRGDSEFSEAAEAKLWSIYNAEAEKYDKNLAQNWRGDMNAILIFAGLFSASLTAFIIESYGYLQPDPQDTTVAILQHVSSQLAFMTNGSNANTVTAFNTSSQASFQAPTSILVCNALWFFSLGFSLISALGATLVDQWVRRYLQATQRRSDPASRARVRAYLFHGLQQYQMDAIVEAIPMLLHISLLLFFAGLYAFLSPLNRIIGAICLVILTTGVLLYAACTLLPLFRHTCPFHTPLSSTFWGLSRYTPRPWCSSFGSRSSEKTHSLTEWKELQAVEDGASRPKQDIQSLGWLVRSLADDEQIELLAEALPPLSHGSKNWNALFPDILASPDGFEIGKSLVRLLQACLDESIGYAKQQSRFRICLSAVYWLTVLPFSTKLHGEGASSRYWLDACSAEIIAVLSDPNSYKSRTLQVEDYLSCAYVSVLSKSLLDAQMNIVSLKEQISSEPRRKLVEQATFQRLSNYPLFWSQKLPRLSDFMPSNWLLKFHFHSYVRLKTISLNPLNRLDRNPSDLSRILNDLETSIAQNQFVILLEYLRNALVSLNGSNLVSVSTSQYIEPTATPYEFDRTVSILWSNITAQENNLNMGTCMDLVDKVYKHHVTKSETGGLWRWRLKYDYKLSYDVVYMDLSRIRARPVPQELSQDYLDAIDFVMECVWRMSETGKLLNVEYRGS